MVIGSATANVSNTNTLTLSTNGANGAAVTAQDAYTGLKNALQNYTIASVSGGPVTLSSEGFGMGENSAPSTGTIAAKYSTSSVSQVGNLTTSPATFWTITAPVVNATATPYFNAYVSALADAGVYSDTVTFVATGVY